MSVRYSAVGFSPRAESPRGTPATSTRSRSAPPSRVGLAVVATFLTLACVTSPRPVATTRVTGPIAAGSTQRGADDTEAVFGPLRMLDAEVRWPSSDVMEAAWRVRVQNPSRNALEVTVVLTIVDQAGETVIARTRTLRLSGRQEELVGGAEPLTPTQRQAARGWSLVYWVRRVPAAERRAWGISD